MMISHPAHLRRWLPLLVAAVTLLTLAGAAHPADAATRCVSPAGGRCLTTIQLAVDAALPADVIVVNPGVYYENVVIPAGKDGLTITGVPSGGGCTPNAVRLDAAPSRTASVAGTGVSVLSNNVHLQCLTIRNGNHAVDATANGLRLSRLRAIRQSSDNVRIAGDGFAVAGSEFIGGGDNGLDITGSNGTIGRSIISNQDNGCLDISGNGNVILSNTIRLCEDGEGIYASGANITVALNTISATDSDCIYVSGAAPIVTGNR